MSNYFRPLCHHACYEASLPQTQPWLVVQGPTRAVQEFAHITSGTEHYHGKAPYGGNKPPSLAGDRTPSSHVSRARQYSGFALFRSGNGLRFVGPVQRRSFWL